MNHPTMEEIMADADDKGQRRGLRLAAADDDNVVSLRQKPSREGWSKQEQDALTIARLAALPLLEYERQRIAGAKEIGCRVSWLDRVVKYIHELGCQIKFQAPPQGVELHQPGEPITFHPPDADSVVGFVVISGFGRRYEYWQDKPKQWDLIVLADGNGTALWSVPIAGRPR
jgi:hypothetical protein